MLRGAQPGAVRRQTQPLAGRGDAMLGGQLPQALAHVKTRGGVVPGCSFSGNNYRSPEVEGLHRIAAVLLSPARTESWVNKGAARP